MRTPSRASAAAAGDPSAASPRDAEALFRTKKIAEIRSVEASTMKEIEEKKEELRQLVGTSYRDLIDSADTIVQMKSSTESISDNLDRIDAAIRSLSASADPETPKLTPNPARARVYGIACRVKYLVDTPENIWGCLDESMLWEAAGRYLRAKEVHWIITASGARGGTGVGFSAGDHTDVLAKFPLLRHQWQIVESFKGQISQRSRERLMDQGLTVGAYSDALAAAATIDDLDPKQTVGLFLESRRSWISQILFGVDMAVADSDSISTVLCYIMKIIRATLGHVGELFLQALNDLPLFYRTVLGSPPGTQLFGGIPNPEEEVARWKLHREKLESIMVTLEPDYIAHCASSWLSDCCREIFGKKIGGRRLVEIIDTGEALGRAEKLIRETLDTRDGLEGTLEQWLKSAFGSEIESVWDQIRTIILKDGKDILDDILEEVFVQRMKEIVHAGFDRLSRDVNISEVVQAIADPVRGKGLTSYLKSHSTGGVWFREPSHRKLAIGSGFKPSIDENDFQNCLNAYFGTEVSSIRDTVDSRCKMIMEDLLSFVEYHNSFLRLKELAPYLQDKCHKTISSLLQGVKHLIGQLSTSLENPKGKDCSPPPSLIVTRALFIGRLLFAFRNHSSHIPLILGSPRLWVKDTVNALTNHSQSPSSRYSKFAFESPVPFSPRGKGLDSPRSPRKSFFDSSRRQTISAAAALFPSDDNNRSKLEEITKRLRDLCIKAHSLWILWVSSEISDDLLKELEKDDSLSSGTPLKGWEVTVIRQESSEGSQEIKIELPSMPSLYITSFLFQACQEIHRIGGHVLDRLILQNLAWSLLEKMAGVYDKYLSKMDDQVPRVSANGALQILFDLRFASDVLSGGRDASSPESDPIDTLKATVTKYAFRRKQTQFRPDTANDERVRKLIQILAQKRDPIDWAIEESYLWENEKQSYKRYSVLFGFLVQLNHMYMDTVQKLPTKSNTESNILRCSTVPRFKYLPISAPALASRGGHNPLFSSDDGSRSPWKGYLNGEQSPKPDMDENSSFGATTPLFKSFMTQVGSKFGESTSRLGSMLSDAQVGMFRDRSAAAMSTFGDMLPGPAAGLLSSFTVGAARSDF